MRHPSAMQLRTPCTETRRLKYFLSSFLCCGAKTTLFHSYIARSKKEYMCVGALENLEPADLLILAGAVLTGVNIQNVLLQNLCRGAITNWAT